MPPFAQEAFGRPDRVIAAVMYQASDAAFGDRWPVWRYPELGADHLIGLVAPWLTVHFLARI
jgi:hypothetical protein